MRSDTNIHPLSRTMKSLGIGLAALILPLGLTSPAVAENSGPEQPAASSQNQTSGPTTWNVLVGSESHDQSIQGMAFLPKNIYVDAGDTVNWKANSAEIHTVTFLATDHSLPMFNPGDPTQLFQVGGDVYDGHSYYNSGVMTTAADSGFPAVTDYSLTFPTEGDFTYYCLVHGMMQMGMVHVGAANDPYPYTQAQYDRQAAVETHATVLDGNRLRADALRASDNHKVIEGADDNAAMVMQFLRPVVTIHVGESVTFENRNTATPHTVTFGEEPQNPFASVGDPTNFSGGQLSSGILEPGSGYKVTFNSAGTFDYICALHDFMGMVGKVIVEP
jgi:plastocyanin